MNKMITRRDYARRLARVVEHIDGHLDADLNLDALAEIACLSPYHFHRVYHAYQGETIAATVRRIRLERAAGLLINSSKAIAAIAAAAGYGSTAAFTRAFARHYGQTPAKYREDGFLVHPIIKPKKDFVMSYEVAIKDKPAMRVATLAHRGSYLEIGSTFEKLNAWAMAGNHFGPNSQMLGIYYDDPSAIPEADLRSDAALTVADDVTDDGQVVIKSLDKTTCATTIHRGPYAELPKAYEWLYGAWLPQSGREPADAACIEIYLNNPRTTAPADLLTEICMPIRA